MSLKPVEMQIAIPRTTEATSIQNQLNQKPAQDQAALADMTSKRMELQRKKSAEVDQTALNAKGDGKSGGSANQQSNQRKRSDSSAEAADGGDYGHPYKGRHIDISL